MIKDRFAGPVWAGSLLLLGVGGYAHSGIAGLCSHLAHGVLLWRLLPTFAMRSLHTDSQQSNFRG